MPAKSDDQQQAAGMALAAKRGEKSVSELGGAAKDMYESMSESELEDYAETSHEDKSEDKEGALGHVLKQSQYQGNNMNLIIKGMRKQARDSILKQAQDEEEDRELAGLRSNLLRMGLLASLTGAAGGIGGGILGQELGGLEGRTAGSGLGMLLGGIGGGYGLDRLLFGPRYVHAGKEEEEPPIDPSKVDPELLESEERPFALESNQRQANINELWKQMQ